MLQASLRRGRPASLASGNRLVLSSTKPGSEKAASSLVQNQRTYATSAAATEAGHQTPTHSTPSAGAAAKGAGLPALGSIEASWVGLPREQQEQIHSELQELQKKDWKELSLDQQKASYYIAYGPHGPRAPIVPPNTNGKVFLGVTGAIIAAFGVFAAVRSGAPAKPKTMSQEWKEAQNEYAKEQKMDPFTGVSRADGKGKQYSTTAVSK